MPNHASKASVTEQIWPRSSPWLSSLPQPARTKAMPMLSGNPRHRSSSPSRADNYDEHDDTFARIAPFIAGLAGMNARVPRVEHHWGYRVVWPVYVGWLLAWPDSLRARASALAVVRHRRAVVAPRRDPLRD